VTDAHGRLAAEAVAGSSVQKAYTRAAAERRDFELRVAYVGGRLAAEAASSEEDGQGGGGGSGAAGGQWRVGVLHFRFAQHAGVDGSTPLIGIPNFLPSTGEAPAFYFATLRELGPAPPPPRPSGERARGAAAAGGSSSGSWPRGEGGSASAVSSSTAAIMSGVLSSSGAGGAFYELLEDSGAYADIRLGPLLGRGSFGRVYRGARARGRGCARAANA
jgi:hypothetical protein